PPLRRRARPAARRVREARAGPDGRPGALRDRRGAGRGGAGPAGRGPGPARPDPRPHRASRPPLPPGGGLRKGSDPEGPAARRLLKLSGPGLVADGASAGARRAAWALLLVAWLAFV